jgi:predicted nucleic acid-binding protein
MSEYAVFDASVLIDNWRTNRNAARMANFGLLIRNCSVVLAELWRGATEPEERETLRILEKNHAILTPTQNNWIESGHILAKLRDEKGIEPAKLRDLHFDVLIALTVRANGARLITSNRADFELIREYREFKLEVW